MSNVNAIQNAIMELEGGAFQKLFDAYLYKKYKFENIQTLGVQTGTNKPTKGTPDSYVLLESGEYILINYGSVSSQPASKIRSDILSCFKSAKLSLDKSKIKKIICGYCSTNIHLEQFNSLMEQLEGIEIKLIGIDTISHDLALIYPNLAYDYLQIEIDSHQIFNIDDFVTVYDANGINAPIDCKFHYRENEVNDLVNIVKNNKVSVVIGASGVGKTRLVLESCRTLENEGWSVLCVRSNGALLYNDLRYYFSEKGRYILFLDDANTVSSFENVLDYLMTLSNDVELKVIITLRDYAKERVVESIIKYTKPALYLLNTIKDDEIKGILKANFGIVNELYLKKISEIACGNIRLAVLAGLKSVENGYEAINNAEDIFRFYYGNVIESSNITRDELIILFFVALLGPIRKNDNQLYKELVESYLPNIDENALYEHLFSLELIDWFKNEIIKISDQSFSNYILYYVLFEKRWIDLSRIIFTGLRDYRQKIIYALNTLMELFKSEGLTKYIEDNINDAWNNSCEKDELLYVESFHAVNSVKALLILKKYVDNSEIIGFDLRKFDINKHKNNHRISTKEIEILAGYKYTEYLEEALELLLRFFEKQPDKIMDVYFTIADGIMFDKYSCANKYKNESLILNKLWEKCEMGKDYNFSIWNNYIDWLKDNYDRNGYAHSIVDRIWEKPNYEKNIEYAYKQLIGDIVWSFNAEPAKLLFRKVDDEILYARKKGWLLVRLYANINDIEECKVLINIVTVVYPDWEIEYLLEYLKLNKNCDDFKKLYLFPLSESWSGSQIPLINNKIDLLQSLNKQISGLDYLEHKAYIEERINGLEEYRDKVEIREYLENASYA